MNLNGWDVLAILVFSPMIVFVGVVGLLVIAAIFSTPPKKK